MNFEVKMSRPEKPIDWRKVDQLLMAGCFGSEIAEHFDMHPNTFYDRVFQEYNMGFTEYSSLKRAQGDGLLRARQFKKALEGDNTMLIWLGKIRLNQKEQENKITDQEIKSEIRKAIAELNRKDM